MLPKRAAALCHLQHLILKGKSNEPQTFSWITVVVTVSRLEVFGGDNLALSVSAEEGIVS